MFFYKPTPFKRRPIMKLLIGFLVLMLHSQTIYPQKCQKCDLDFKRDAITKHNCIDELKKKRD